MAPIYSHRPEKVESLSWLWREEEVTLEEQSERCGITGPADGGGTRECGDLKKQEK